MALLPRKFRTRHIRRRYRRLLYRRAMLLGGAVCVGIMLLIGITYAPFLQVRTVQVTGARPDDHARVADIADEILRTSYGYIIPKRFIVWYPKQAIAAAVADAFPAFSGVHPHLNPFSGLTIAVEERTPAALWCGDIVPNDAYTPGVCYYMDEAGFIYERAPSPPPSVYVWLYGALDQSDPIKATFLNKDTLATFTRLEQSLKDAGVPVRAILVNDEQDAELYLEQGQRILVAYADDPDDLSSRLIAVLNADALKNIDLHMLDYIDLRFGNKVYYKVKGQ